MEKNLHFLLTNWFPFEPLLIALFPSPSSDPKIFRAWMSFRKDIAMIDTSANRDSKACIRRRRRRDLWQVRWGYRSDDSKSKSLTCDWEWGEHFSSLKTIELKWAVGWLVVCIGFMVGCCKEGKRTLMGLYSCHAQSFLACELPDKPQSWQLQGGERRCCRASGAWNNCLSNIYILCPKDWL